MKVVLVLLLFSCLARANIVGSECHQDDMSFISHPNNLHGNVSQRLFSLDCPVLMAYDYILSSGMDFGSSLAVYHEGCLEIDLVAGNRTDDGEPFNWNTISQGFSTNKGACATVAAMMVSRGYIRWEDKVARNDTWPEFGAWGKENITFQMLVSHGACIPVLNYIMEVNQTLNSSIVDFAITNQTLVDDCTPGVNYGYMLQDYCSPIDAVLRRKDPHHRNIQQFIEQEVLPYIENAEYHFTIDPVNMTSVSDRIAELTNATADAVFSEFWIELCSSPLFYYQCLALSNPVGTYHPFAFNDPYFRNIYFPGTSGYYSSRTLAGFYAMMAHNPLTHKLMTPHIRDQAWTIVYSGLDFMTGATNASETRSGFQTPTSSNPFSSYADSTGRDGLGGPLCYGNKELSIGFCYNPRNVVAFGGINNPATKIMIDAVETCYADEAMKKKRIPRNPSDYNQNIF